MKKDQKNKLYRWLDKQILATRIMNKPLYFDRPFYVRICDSPNKSIHIYKIDNLCKELNISYQVAEFDSETEEHFFIYKGYKFFGLIKKGVTYEGE